MAEDRDSRLDPLVALLRVQDAVRVLEGLKDEDAHDVMDPLFWTKHGRGEGALEGLREVARHYAEEHGAGTTFCFHCADPVDDPREAEQEAHADCARAERPTEAGEEGRG